jgi:integrase
LGVWTETWIGIVERSRKPSTAKTYRTHIKYLQPLAGVRLDRLTSEHVEQLYVGLLARGVLPVSVQGAHRTYRSCLGDAVKRGWLSRNPVTAARPGTVEEREVVPLTIVEARAILAAASQHPNAVKWAIALGLGLRQGEALGLQWADIDLAAGTLSVRRSLRQGRWQHGCADPGACSARPQNCPRRHGGGLIVGAPKSKRSTRTIVLPRPLQAALKAHRSAQASERLAAGESGGLRHITVCTPGQGGCSPVRLASRSTPGGTGKPGRTSSKWQESATPASTTPATRRQPSFPSPASTPAP